MDVTPVKSPAASISLQISSDDDSDDVSDQHEHLVGSLSAMKIHRDHGFDSDDLGKEVLRAKRRHLSERFTVEGSPFVKGGDVKRRDLLPTPSKSHFTNSLDELAAVHRPPSPILEHDSSHSSTPSLSPVFSAASATAAVTVAAKDRLLVIFSNSDEHDTGNHQENALRSAVLCGPQGALRRDAVYAHTDWKDTKNLAPPPLADLMRSVLTHSTH
jgi:hypothetical protein